MSKWHFTFYDEIIPTVLSFIPFHSFHPSFFLSFFSNFPSSFLPFRTKGPYERTTGLDREQSLFFFRFCDRSARARERRVARGRHLEKAILSGFGSSLSFSVPLPSRALSHASGYSCVSGVSLEGLRIKRHC